MIRKRICACHDDTISKKQKLFREMRQERVPDDGKVINIGIVFHICYEDFDVKQIPSDIQYSIDMMNKDFNMQSTNFDIGKNKYTNPDLKQTYLNYIKLANACKINFYHVDTIYSPVPPQNSGNVSILDKNIKGKSKAVHPEKYLNLWIADLNNGLLGYAQFPWENSPDTDGVVIAHPTFGKNPTYPEFNLNKTMTHEVGHWLGLYHTFQETFSYGGGVINYQDGTPEEEIQEVKGDCIADTPPQSTPTYGNPFTNPNYWPTSKPSDETKSYRHMFMNFMDYSDDTAMFMFTHDQAIKIRQMIYIYRNGIITNQDSSNPPIITPPVTEPVKPVIDANYDFDNKKNGFVGEIELSGNTSIFSNVAIVSSNANSGIRCLRTRRNGKGILKINLTNAPQVTLSFYAYIQNASSYIMVKPPGYTQWLSAKLNINNKYTRYNLVLPQPYSSSNPSELYQISFGTNGTNIQYSYFDDINISNSNNTNNKEKNNINLVPS